MAGGPELYPTAERASDLTGPNITRLGGSRYKNYSLILLKNVLQDHQGDLNALQDHYVSGWQGVNSRGDRQFPYYSRQPHGVQTNEFQFVEVPQETLEQFERLTSQDPTAWTQRDVRFLRSQMMAGFANSENPTTNHTAITAALLLTQYGLTRIDETTDDNQFDRYQRHALHWVAELPTVTHAQDHNTTSESIEFAEQVARDAASQDLEMGDRYARALRLNPLLRRAIASGEELTVDEVGQLQDSMDRGEFDEGSAALAQIVIDNDGGLPDNMFGQQGRRLRIESLVRALAQKAVADGALPESEVAEFVETAAGDITNFEDAQVAGDDAGEQQAAQATRNHLLPLTIRSHSRKREPASYADFLRDPDGEPFDPTEIPTQGEDPEWIDGWKQWSQQIIDALQEAKITEIQDPNQLVPTSVASLIFASPFRDAAKIADRPITALPAPSQTTELRLVRPEDPNNDLLRGQLDTYFQYATNPDDRIPDQVTRTQVIRDIVGPVADLRGIEDQLAQLDPQSTEAHRLQQQRRELLQRIQDRINADRPQKFANDSREEAPATPVPPLTSAEAPVNSSSTPQTESADLPQQLAQMTHAIQTAIRNGDLRLAGAILTTASAANIEALALIKVSLPFAFSGIPTAELVGIPGIIAALIGLVAATTGGASVFKPELLDAIENAFTKLSRSSRRGQQGN